MEEDTTVCTNCQRPIASNNHVMHSLHCHRNLEKCRVCGDAVPRSEMSEHAEQHVEKSCSDCGTKVPKDRHEAHKINECKFRKMSCEYCTLEVPGTELQEHESYCGSRTEQCADCGKFVMIKYQQLHLDTNHSFLKLDDESVPSPPPKLGDFLVRKPHKQSQLYTGLPRNVPDLSSLDRLLALNLGEEDSMLAGPHQDSASSSSNNYSYLNGEDSVSIPCEFCQTMVPSDKLMDHQTGCSPDVTSFPQPKTAAKITKTSVNSALKNGYRAEKFSASAKAATPVYTIDDSDDEVTILSSDGIEAELPCEFCDGAYPASLLNQHQEICESRLAADPAHHWSMPTPGARRITPPLTRKRLSAEAKAANSQALKDDEVTEETAGPRTTNSNLNRGRNKESKY